ncbi:MAG: hypothetical protein ACOY4U_04500 [Pseudomonadota bacterium]
MTTLAEIRAAIVAKLGAVTNAGTVHSYERFAKTEKELRALYEYGVAPSNRILGWHVRRVAKSEKSHATGRCVVVNTWQIRGVMGFDDADQSEILFDNLVEAIGDAFRPDDALGGVAETALEDMDGIAGIQVEDSGPVMFAGMLCHSAKLKLVTRHYL